MSRYTDGTGLRASVRSSSPAATMGAFVVDATRVSVRSVIAPLPTTPVLRLLVDGAPLAHLPQLLLAHRARATTCACTLQGAA